MVCMFCYVGMQNLWWMYWIANSGSKSRCDNTYHYHLFQHFHRHIIPSQLHAFPTHTYHCQIRSLNQLTSLLHQILYHKNSTKLHLLIKFLVPPQNSNSPLTKETTRFSPTKHQKIHFPNNQCQPATYSPLPPNFALFSTAASTMTYVTHKTWLKSSLWAHEYF